MSTLPPLAENKAVIVTFLSSAFFLAYKVVDVAGNVEFLLQRIGVNESVAKFLGSSRGIDFMVAVSLLALVVTVGVQVKRFQTRQDKTANEPDTAGEHDECQQTIRNLESMIRRLQESNETLGMQVNARDGQINRLEEEIKGALWLRKIAEDQAHAIHRFVSITDSRIGQHELFRHDPYIEFAIMVWNRSVYDISLGDIDGVMSFLGRELTDPLEWRDRPRIVAWGNQRGFTFRQKLTKDDVTYSKRTRALHFWI